MAVRERFPHLPMKVARCAIEPVVDQFRDFGAPVKGTVKGVMIDPVLGKEARKPPKVDITNLSRLITGVVVCRSGEP